MNAALARLAAPTAPAPAEEKHEHAVENGVIRHLSISQVKAFIQCERLWYQNKVLHLPTKVFKSQQIGIEGHAQNEHYLKTGEDVLGPIARAGKHLLPAPGPDLLVEAPLPGLLTAAGIPFHGFIDILNARRRAQGVLRITDHKFTKSIEKYAARADDLITTKHGHGIQMIGYARSAWLSGQFDWARTYELEHLYFQTQGPKLARPVLAVVPASPFDAEWEPIERTAERMKVVARAKSLDEVRPNWSACDDYGGCSFRAQCFVHQSRASSASPQSTQGAPMSMMNRLLKSAGAPAAVPPATASVPAPQPVQAAPSNVVISAVAAPPTPAAPAKPVLIEGLVKVRDCALGEPYLTSPGVVGEFTGTSKDFGFFQTAGGTVRLAGDALVEPVKAAVPAPQPVAPVVVAAAPIIEAAPVAQPVTPAPIPAATEAAPAATETPAQTEEKAKRTRRTKAEMEAARAAEAPAATPATELRLFVNAMPNAPAEPLAPYLAGIVGQIEKAFDVVDIRCAPKKTADGKDHQLAFGGWKGALASAIKSEPPKAGTYVVLGADSELVQVAVEALESIAAPGCFVRGVR